MKIKRKTLFLWGYIVAICAAFRGLIFIMNINSPLLLDSDYTLEVTPGITFNQLVTRLNNQGVLEYPFDIRLYARLAEAANSIKAGEYLLSPGITGTQLLAKLVAGDVVIHQVRVLEGWTLTQAINAIQSHEAIAISLESNNEDQLRELFGTDVYPEGLVFPDTYNFSRGTTDQALLLRANALMESILAAEWESRDVGLPYDTPYQALIMASIIEKETGLASEREQIAGVFIRRLQRGMRLQTDPTVIYGLGQDFSGDLTRADLRRQTPYNTYLNAGLPPTPIALPGRESIAASLHPDQGDTLYFVSRGDGSHYFSRTLEEHEEAVRRYQLNNEQ